jgi:hypothetical protein
VLLSEWATAFDFDLNGEAVDVADALHGGAREVLFQVTAELVAAANASVGGSHGGRVSRCNGVLIEVSPRFDLLPDELPAPQRRAVHFVSPFMVAAGEEVAVSARHDGVRMHFTPPERAPKAAPGLADGWGTMLLQHWHFAMLRDAPRNNACAATYLAAALPCPTAPIALPRAVC